MALGGPRLRANSTSGNSASRDEDKNTDEKDSSSSGSSSAGSSPPTRRSRGLRTTSGSSGSSSSGSSSGKSNESTPTPVPDEEPEREPTTTTNSDQQGEDMTQDYNDSIDLGQGGTGATSGNYDFENHAGAVIETSRDIQEAGGPTALLAGNIDDANAITTAIGDVSGQIRDAQNGASGDGPMNMPENVPDVPETVTQYVPVPSGGGNSGMVTALAVGAVALLAGLVFG